MEGKPTNPVSPNRKAWLRLKRNKPAIAGLSVIVFSMLLAILGYAITPDKTTNANDQINELPLTKPGFAVKMLYFSRNREIADQSFLTTMLFGKPSPYQSIPVNHFTLHGDSATIEVYRGVNEETGEKIAGSERTFHKLDIAFALSPGNQDIVKTATGFEFTDIHNQRQTIEFSALDRKVDRQFRTAVFLMGTDLYGRCILSRLILGVRISLLVGLVAVAISLSIGLLLGALAGYYGGKTDDVIMFLVNTVWSIPTLLLVFAIMLALGRGFWQIFIAVGLTMWVDVARIVRGQIMSLREMQYIEAAVGFGFSNFRIIVRHIMPNILGPVMVITAANFATAILIEAGLSYLGFGIQPPQPSWGTMIRENYVYLFSNNPFPALIPAAAIMMMVLAFNLLGNGLRDALDVQSKILK